MILIDTTVWVDYFNGYTTAETDYLDLILGLEDVIVGDIILGEVLQGFRKDTDFEQAKEKLGRFTQVSMLNPQLAIRSALNYRFLRKKGITVRKTIDCFIATYCIETGLVLLHSDHDFDPFENHLRLKVVHP